MQLTTDTGLTTDPALSPDGKLLAYASDRSGEGNLDIWVRQIGGGEPIRLTQDLADEREPTFSPDGTMIAFRSEKEGGGIYVVSALGGPSRKIAPEGRRPRFSPDGSQIAYWSGTIGGGAAFSARNYCRIFVVASAGGAPRQVRPDFVGAAYPEWAPDGKHLLFVGNRDEKLPVDENIDWWVTPLDEGPAIATGAFRATQKEGLTGPFLVYPWALIAPVWETRGGSLIFSARSGDSRNLWRLGISTKTWKVTGLPQRLTSSPTIEESPSVALVADGSVKIAFASLSENTDIWSLPLEANTGKVTGELRQLTRDTTADFHPSLSADGKKVAFVSAHSGN
jgi:Tol biopolymer transport system component